MVANRPSRDEHKPTLIVCPSSIVSQWWAEIEKHVEKKIFPRIFRFQASSVESILGPDFQSALEDNDVILTTYQEVMASYPRFKPPKEVVDFKSWWVTEFETKRGTLHRYCVSISGVYQAKSLLALPFIESSLTKLTLSKIFDRRQV